jgi:hypothetical protein
MCPLEMPFNKEQSRLEKAHEILTESVAMPL